MMHSLMSSMEGQGNGLPPGFGGGDGGFQSVLAGIQNMIAAKKPLPEELTVRRSGDQSAAPSSIDPARMVSNLLQVAKQSVDGGSPAQATLQEKVFPDTLACQGDLKKANKGLPPYTRTTPEMPPLHQDPAPEIGKKVEKNEESAVPGPMQRQVTDAFSGAAASPQKGIGAEARFYDDNKGEAEELLFPSHSAPMRRQLTEMLPR